MTLIKEVKRVIAQLPIEQAAILSYWLNEYEAARRYKNIKAYAMTAKIVADFQKSNGDASLN